MVVDSLLVARKKDKCSRAGINSPDTTNLVPDTTNLVSILLVRSVATFRGVYLHHIKNCGHLALKYFS